LVSARKGWDHTVSIFLTRRGSWGVYLESVQSFGLLHFGGGGMVKLRLKLGDSLPVWMESFKCRRLKSLPVN